MSSVIAANSSSSSLIELRAGKMMRSGTTVSADPRKGWLAIKKEDDLIHVLWKDRISNTVEDDLIVFPGDASLEHVPQCTTGRVYVLKFKSASDHRVFFWIQEPDNFDDVQNIRRINALLNPHSLFNATSTMDTGSSIQNAPIHQTVNASENSSNATQLSNDALQRIVSNLLQRRDDASVDIPLREVLTAGSIMPILQRLSTNELQQLFDLLPHEAPKSLQELESVIRSPQFAHTLQSIEAAAQRELPSLLIPFGVDEAHISPTVGARGLIESFINQANASRKRKTPEPEDDASSNKKPSTDRQ